jgi:hypothetical protein
MKINLIPSKKLALLSAVFCAAMLAFSQNARAVTVLNIGGADPHGLGDLVLGFETPQASEITDIVNHMIGMAPPSTDGFLGLEVNRFNNHFGTLPTAVFGPAGVGANINNGSGLYSYLWARYESLNGFAIANVWYIGDLSGDITIPTSVTALGGLEFHLTTSILFTAVPDGGTTVMLLGAALGALGMARRFLKA